MKRHLSLWNLFGIILLVGFVSANYGYGHGGGHYEHKCIPKITVKHHTVPVYVPYTVYEKYPVYKYEKYPVHVPVKYPVYVKVKEEKKYGGYHGGGDYHGGGGDDHYGGGHDEYGHGGGGDHYADEPAKKKA